MPSKEYRQVMLRRSELPQWISGKGFLRRGERKGHRVPDHLVDIFCLPGNEVIRSQHRQPGSKLSEVYVYACGQHAVKFQ